MWFQAELRAVAEVESDLDDLSTCRKNPMRAKELVTVPGLNDPFAANLKQYGRLLTVCALTLWQDQETHM